MKTKSLIIAATVLFCGCLSVGTKVDPGSVANLRKGETTYGQAIQMLGTPNYETVSADATRTVTYYYVKSSARAVDFVPVVGALAGGADSQTNSTILRFDQRGVLIDASTMQGQTERTMGC